MTDFLHALANQSGLIELIGASVLMVIVMVGFTFHSWLQARADQRRLEAERRRYARWGS